MTDDKNTSTHFFNSCVGLLLGAILSFSLSAQGIKPSSAITLNNETPWASIIRTTKTSAQYLLIDQQGAIQTLENESLNNAPFLSLKEFYPKSTSLNAIVIHPSFSLTNESGFRTLFTAHTEPVNESKRTFRLTESDDTYSFETVIVEWRLSEGHFNALQSQSHREIVRIPSNSAQGQVKQLAFNPHVQSWQSGYGILFILTDQLSSSKQHTLQSGTILRINPSKSGLRSYSTPDDNPYVNSELAEELYALGLGNVRKMYWLKNLPSQILVHHQDADKQLLSGVKKGDDWREGRPSQSPVYFASVNPITNGIDYRGEQQLRYRNHLIFIEKSTSWQITALSASTNTTEVISTISFEQLPESANLQLFTDENNELKLFDTESGVISDLKLNALGNDSKEQGPKPEPSFFSNPSMIIALLFLFALLVLTIFHAGAKSSSFSQLKNIKKILNSRYSKFSIDEENKALLLFKRHEKTTDLAIPFGNIIKSECYLNDQLISTIDANKETHFSKTHEQEFLVTITKEKREKMIDDKVRKMELSIEDKHKKKHLVCVYYRKGNQRMTSDKFEMVVSHLLDWCWLFSAYLHPEETPKREKPNAVPKREQPAAKVTTHSNNEHARSQRSTVATKSRQVASEQSLNHQTPSPKEPELVNKPLSDANTETHKPEKDIELVKALDKLAQLNAQGLLTNEEFLEAKTKILKDLTRS